MITPDSPEVVSFLAKVNAAYQEYWTRSKYTHAQCPEIRATDKQKFIALIRFEEHGGKYTPGSIHGFIAKNDFANRTLGTIKQGDILKAATYSAPAKNARGNVFDADNGAQAISESGTCFRYM